MGLKAGGPLFAVRDMERSLAFYRDVLGLEVVNDLGANVVPTVRLRVPGGTPPVLS